MKGHWNPVLSGRGVRTDCWGAPYVSPREVISPGGSGAGGGDGRDGNGGTGGQGPPDRDFCVLSCRVTGGELFEDIVAREYYSEADARWVWTPRPTLSCPPLPQPHSCPLAHIVPMQARQMVSPKKLSACLPSLRAWACLLPRWEVARRRVLSVGWPVVGRQQRVHAHPPVDVG